MHIYVHTALVVMVALYAAPMFGIHCLLPNCLSISQTTRWVVKEVLTPQLPRQRAIMIEKFIRIAETCLECKNFNTVFEVTLALQSAPVRRLHQTWQEVSQEVTTAQQGMCYTRAHVFTFTLVCVLRESVLNTYAIIQNLCCISTTYASTHTHTHYTHTAHTHHAYYFCGNDACCFRCSFRLCCCCPTLSNLLTQRTHSLHLRNKSESEIL